VLRCPTSDAAHRIARRLDALRQAGWPAPAATADEADVVLLLRDADPVRIERAAAATHDRHADVECIGVSAPLSALADLPAARRQGLVAAEANRETATAATLFEDLRGLGDVAQRLPPAVAQELVQSTLGPLRDYDTAHGTELVGTLHAYVDHGGRPRETAAALHIHPNTLQQRLRRCAELGGYDVRNLRDVGRIVLALEWERLLAAGAVDSAAGNGATRAPPNSARAGP
jgi:DNA-binding PucR family transcriptional regulator